MYLMVCTDSMYRYFVSILCWLLLSFIRVHASCCFSPLSSIFQSLWSLFGLNSSVFEHIFRFLEAACRLHLNGAFYLYQCTGISLKNSSRGLRVGGASLWNCLPLWFGFESHERYLLVGNQRLLVHSQEQSVPPAVETDSHIKPIRLGNGVIHPVTYSIHLHE